MGHDGGGRKGCIHALTCRALVVRAQYAAAQARIGMLAMSPARLRRKSRTCYSDVDRRHCRQLFEGRMSVDAMTVRRIARLARIAVADEEIDHLAGELNTILAFVEQLSEVDVTAVEPMTSVTPMAMKMRVDRVTDGAIPDAVTQNAPDRQDHFFVVPKVVE
jgi:aspartyl-tRNA(Asn)/glutamyl-tRNA(Gln) amidotransferase subunit C